MRSRHLYLTVTVASSLTAMLAIGCGGEPDTAPAPVGSGFVGQPTPGASGMSTANTGMMASSGGMANPTPVNGPVNNQPAVPGGNEPVNAGNNPPPVNDGNNPPPVNTGNNPPPVDNGMNPPPVDNGMNPPPVATGMDMPPVASGDCTITADAELSMPIPTVGIVTWSTDAMVQNASIEFELADGTGIPQVAPVDLSEPNYRTLLLGMKGERDYKYRVSINDGACVSQEFSITTGPVSNSVPVIDRQVMNEAAVSPGFMVTSAGLGNVGGFGGGAAGGFGGGDVGGGGGGNSMFVFDQDGDVVWWADVPPSTSRARMDWESKNMYAMALNFPGSTNTGQMMRISMDGMERETINELAGGHHDFTVAPGGIVTVITWTQSCSAIVEWSPNGGANAIVPDVSSLYEPTGTECHGNAISYQEEADTYTLSDRNPSLFVRFDRTGKLMWQFGGSNPKGMHIQGNWNVNHGHHLLADGTFLFFNNEGGNPSPVHQYKLDESNGTATLDWTYTNMGSMVLGDVQRLPNGNTLITYSNSGTIVELDQNRSVVQQYSTGSLGYTVHRESMYSHPAK